jgi:hypothetical protein
MFPRIPRNTPPPPYFASPSTIIDLEVPGASPRSVDTMGMPEVVILPEQDDPALPQGVPSPTLTELEVDTFGM